MHYTDHFKLADDLVEQFDPVVKALHDPSIEKNYAGLLAVSAITVYELAIKTIFTEFAERKHKVLGNFAKVYFKRLYGRISLDDLRKNHIKNFGLQYLERFKKTLDLCEDEYLRSERHSVKGSYSNLVTWRNEFAHDGRVPTNATYEEVKTAYFYGKKVLVCLEKSMRR